MGLSNQDWTVTTNALDELKADYRPLLRDFNAVANGLNEQNSTPDLRHKMAKLGCDIVELKSPIEAARLRYIVETEAAPRVAGG